MKQFIITQTDDVCQNLSIEEWLYRSYTEASVIVMLWQNRRAVVVGKHQNPWAEADVPFLEAQGIPVVRRISGGGTVFHDQHNINFTVIRDKLPQETVDLSEFTRPIHNVLQRLGCATSSSGRGDVLIDGFKVCGTAQAEMGKRILYHGCILFDSDLDLLRRALRGGISSIETRATASVPSPVTNVRRQLITDIELDEFKRLLLEAFCEYYGDLSELHLPEHAESEIREQIIGKYSSWDWNFGHTPKFSVVSHHRLAPDKVISVARGRVVSVGDMPEHPFMQRRFEPDRML